MCSEIELINSDVVETVTSETETSSKIPRPRFETTKFVDFAEIFQKNVVIISKLNFFEFLRFFRPVLFFSYLCCRHATVLLPCCYRNSKFARISND